MNDRNSNPDLILRGGKVTTLDRANPLVAAVAISKPPHPGPLVARRPSGLPSIADILLHHREPPQRARRTNPLARERATREAEGWARTEEQLRRCGMTGWEAGLRIEGFRLREPVSSALPDETNPAEDEAVFSFSENARKQSRPTLNW